MQNELLSIPEACQVLGCKPTFLYSQLSEGKILAVKLGKKTMIPRNVITDYINNLPTFKKSGE